MRRTESRSTSKRIAPARVAEHLGIVGSGDEQAHQIVNADPLGLGDRSPHPG